jgi:hypothetical protein
MIQNQLTGETITNSNTFNNTSSWDSSTSYTINTSFNNNYLFPLTSIKDSSVTALGTSAFPWNGVYQSSSAAVATLQKVDMPNVTSIGNGVFANQGNLSYVNMPKLVSIGTVVFTGACALNGTGSFNSAITASGDWDTSGNLQQLQAKGWQINYINS